MNLTTTAGIANGSSPPAPLKTIVNTKASPVCAVLRGPVRDALSGLSVNDKMIDQGRLVFGQMARDVFAGGVGMDYMNLRRVSYAIASNIERIQRILSDPLLSSYPQNKLLSSLRQNLQAIVAQQSQALNIINGVADTMAMGQLVKSGDDAARRAILGMRNTRGVGGSGTGNNGGGAAPLSSVSLAQADATLPVTQRLPPTEFANNPYAELYLAVALQRQKTAAVEQPASQSILDAVADCSDGH